MKNFNLIKRLWTDSHEKQSPQRFGRYAAMLIMLLTLGVGQMWAAVTLYYQKDMPAGNYSASNSASMTQSSVNSNRYSCSVSLQNGSYGFYIKNGSDYYKVSATASTNSDVLLYNYGSTNYGNSNHRVTYNTGAAGYFIFTFDASNNKVNVSPRDGLTVKVAWDVASGHDSNYNLDNYTTLTEEGSTGKYSADIDLTAVKHYMFVQTDNSRYWKAASTLSINGSVSLYDYGTSNYGNSADKVNFTPSAAAKYRFTWDHADKTIKIQRLYNISYQKGDNGIGSTQTDYKVHGTNITLRSSGDFSRTGYNHTAWNTSSTGSGGTSYALGASYTSNANLTLYPTWTAKTTTVTLQANAPAGQTVTGGGTQVTATYDAALPSFSALTCNGGYALTGYWTTASGEGTKVINANGTFAANSGIWNRTDGATLSLHARWSLDRTLTYDDNGSTGGSVPASPTVYANGASVTVLGNTNSLVKTGYTFTGWNTAPGGGGTSYSAGSTITMNNNYTLYAQWSENLSTVSVEASPSGSGTFSSTSVSAGVDTKPTVTATAQPGYKFSSWGISGGANISGTTDNPVTITGKGAGADATLTATFNRTYAYIEGRMTVYNAARNSKTHIASSEGEWDVSSTRIKMDYDETNHRFYRHTYMTPKELSTEQSSNEQYFFFKTSTSSSSLANEKIHRPSEGRTLTAAGTGNKKETGSSTGSNSIWFNSSDESGYALLYFDEAGVWYELEQSLKYDANGGSGDAPTPAYYLKGTNATAASNPFTARAYYTFGGWNTAQYITGTNYAAGASVTMNANTTLYAKWTRTITLNQEDATISGTTSVTGTYNCATLPSITNPSKTGYTFNGWYTEVAGGGNLIINTSGALQADKFHWTDASGRFDRTTTKDGAPLYAKWTQTVTLNANLANHGSGDNTTATIVYKATAKTSITHCTPATGYHLVGYYTAATDGVKVLNADGSFAGSAVTDYITDGKWTKAGATTLYAHYEANTYTIAFDPNDANYVGEATGTTASIAATYDVSYTLTTNGYSREGYTFAGWSQNADGTGEQYTDGQTGVSNLTSTNAGTATLYAKWTPSTYTVSLNDLEGTCATKSMVVTMGSTYGAGTPPLPEAAAVTPPTGYVFDGWYTAAGGGTKVTGETQVTTAVDHTLYAHYIQKAQVYFKNTLGWSKVYVTYDAYWDSGHNPSWGSGNSGRIYHEMTQITGTDIYYDDIPDAVLSSWKGNICFNSQQLGSIPTGDYANFDHGQAVFRRDFDSDATMFVPVPNDPNKFKLNDAYDGTWYYSTDMVVDKDDKDKVTNYRYQNGYWVRYNNVEAGYSLKGSWDDWAADHYIAKETASGTTYTYTIRGLSANTTYGFKLFKHCTTSNTYSSQFSNTGTMTSGNCSNWTFNAASTTGNAGITTTVAGDYTFNFTFGDGKVKLSVDYPFYVGDYKVVYSYTKDGAKTYESEIIKCRANGLDTISVFIHSSSDASSRSLKIAQCTGINASGVPTWDNSYATIDISSVSESGVYNFIITQDGSAAASGAYWNKYTGNYYIRTAASDGGWDMYKYRPNNIMTLSEYSLTQTLSDPFSHYYCRFIGSTSVDITYAVATDYSPNISGTMTGDATIGVGSTTLPATANVRFSWNEKTNAMRRAYLKNAQGAGNNRYLVLHGADNKIRNNDASGTEITPSGDLVANELLFTDIGNWVYQVELKAIPGAKVSLIANYNSADRYLVGDGDSKWETIIGGSGSSKYSIRAVYDFKTNRLMTAWIPGGEINENISDVDVLLLRYAQNAGTAITFGGEYTVGAKEVIGAIEMRYNDLVGHVAAWTSSSRPLLKFFVSFPFDVNVSDLFGLNSAYGDAYVIEEYDGAARAEKGFFGGDGITTFWKELQPGDVMLANVGYCVILDNDYFNGDIGNIWDNKGPGSSVYLYFPSASSVGDIKSSSETISIPEHLCHHDRTFITGGSREVNHINTDSHWNMMGVPIFDTHSDSGTSGQPGAVFATSGTDGDGNFNYFYEWSSATNQFSIHTARNYSFKSMHGYMVQYYGDVTFKTAAAPASIAARKAPQKEQYQIELQVLNSNAEPLNSTFVELRENANDAFELNEDVYMSYNNYAVNIYTLTGNYDVAANVLSINDHTIPVGVKVTKAGTYRFSMPGNFSGEVTLLDTFTGESTNLALDDYEVELPKGTTEDRFFLKTNIKKVATSIDGISEDGALKDGKAHKFLQNGVMYILQNGVLYDAQGKRVQ